MPRRLLRWIAAPYTRSKPQLAALTLDAVALSLRVLDAALEARGLDHGADQAGAGARAGDVFAFVVDEHRARAGARPECQQQEQSRGARGLQNFAASMRLHSWTPALPVVSSSCCRFERAAANPIFTSCQRK